MQMRVMQYGKAAPELAATANISAFNLANALGGLIGGFVVDSAFGAGAIPYAAAILPLAALIFILTQERGSSSVPIERAKHRAASLRSLGEEQLSLSSC
jgi:DHA1 family inner membrane transport protein